MLKKAIAILVLGLIIVIYLIVPFFLPPEKSQQFSAWGEDYDDLSIVREGNRDLHLFGEQKIQYYGLENMHEMQRVDMHGAERDMFDLNEKDAKYEVRSIVTSPTILSLDSIDPENSVYIATGLERAYSDEGIEGLTEYLQEGGHVIIADNGKNVGNLASNFGVTYYPGTFYDESFDKNLSYTQIDARLGVDRLTPLYIQEDIEENQLMNGWDLPFPDGVWDDDTDADGKVDEDPLEGEFAPVVDDDKDMGKVIGDGRDNDNDFFPDDGGVDENNQKIEKIGFEEGVNEDIADDDGDGLEDEEFLNGIDDDEDGIIDEDLRGFKIILSDPSGMSSIGSRIIAQGSVNSYVDMNGDGKITTPKPGDPKDELIDAISSPGSEIQLMVEIVVSPDNGMPIDLTGFTESIYDEYVEDVGLNIKFKNRKVSTLELSGGNDIDQATHKMDDIHEFGSIIFIADSSVFINDLVKLDHMTYDWVDKDLNGVWDFPYELATDKNPVTGYPSEADGNFVLDNTDDGYLDYDNGWFFLELIYYLLPDGGTIIFDESRHAINEPFLVPVYATINTVVFLTSDPIYATSLILVTVFILILAVIITRDKDNWVHRFDTSKFKGRSTIPESRRDKARILRKSVLEKVRLSRSLAPEEFSQLSPKVVDSFIRDPQLIELVRNENKEYSDVELKALSDKIFAMR